jgi:hypothetical protein
VQGLLGLAALFAVAHLVITLGEFVERVPEVAERLEKPPSSSLADERPCQDSLIVNTATELGGGRGESASRLAPSAP